MRKFKKVPKTKAGVPVKYVVGSKNPSATEREIKSTAKKYREGKLTVAEMNKIAKTRSKSGTKGYKKSYKA
jgi:pyruvate/2-oxoglutarate dehydrogenase complex dihydrolipoamide acyltransferase (E2) component|tara:strand:+ start:371 stop:583 length:213 start_codon:yes stop_codon:yes gene_type:complete